MILNLSFCAHIVNIAFNDEKNINVKDKNIFKMYTQFSLEYIFFYFTIHA